MSARKNPLGIPKKRWVRYDTRDQVVDIVGASPSSVYRVLKPTG